MRQRIKDTRTGRKKEKMKSKKLSALDFERIAAIKELKKLLPKNKRVYARVLRVSNSGMLRVVHFATIKNNKLYNLDGYINKITRDPFCEVVGGYGLRISGCGLDVIFNALYNVNCWACRYGLIKKSKKNDAHDLRYKGVCDSNYWSM